MELRSGEVDISTQVNDQQDIAIVGMACRFPGAEHYDAFWEMLAADRSSIIEVPRERWDWSAFWGDKHGEGNTTYSRWGGFINDVDAFDPGFFGLSAREAETMDPQQRIMLELAWNSLEDAGIAPSHLSGAKVGVYIGVFNYDYKELQEQPSLIIQTHHSTGTASAVIANRISYYFNFKGPSLPIDTACSSSLNAIHAAVQSLQAGESEVALAGGVNILLTPTRHISFAKTGMLSPTGSCKTFDDSADGYVRGEGAGMLVLKRMAQALEDGDHIYGIVKGSAINHSGKTHTLTYPNPAAQAEVISEAYRRAGISPLSVGYIETHGTGTPKGDPIEFEGLCTAFQQLAAEEGSELKKGYCALGAVKSNIGHLEAAAGMAGVIKTLLAFKHKQLPKLHHFKHLNHRIKLRHTPFYMLDTLKPWKVLKDKQGQPMPRRAGVSSFGFGGTNAHVLLQEPPEATRAARRKNSYSAYLICLSAKTREALYEKHRMLSAWLNQQGEQVSLLDLSATLLAGREHFAVRSAIVVSSLEELSNKLNMIIGGEKPAGYAAGSSEAHTGSSEAAAINIAKELFGRGGKRGAYQDKLLNLAERFVAGEQWDASPLSSFISYKRLALPTYPFAKERHWLSSDTLIEDINIRTGAGSGNSQVDLHPLLHRNTSNLLEHRYSSGWEMINTRLTSPVETGTVSQAAPALACLEMARAAFALSDVQAEHEQQSSWIYLRDVVWPKEMRAVSAANVVHTTLVPFADEIIGFELYGDENEERPGAIFSQGQLLRKTRTEARLEDLQLHSIEQEWEKIVLPAQMPNVMTAYALDGSYLIQLELLPGGTMLESCVLRPDWMGEALESAVCLLTGEEEGDARFTMHSLAALRELHIYGECSADMWVMLRPESFDKSSNRLLLDFNLYDADGALQFVGKGLEIFLELHEEKGSAGEDLEAHQRYQCYLQKQWVLQPSLQKRAFRGEIAVLANAETEHIAAALRHRLPQHKLMLFMEEDLQEQSAQLLSSGTNWENCHAWVDVTGCSRIESAELQETWDWIPLLQNVIEHKRKHEFIVLGVTQGLEAHLNDRIHRAGAARAGLYRLLQSEYRHLVSRHVDVERQAEADSIAEVIAAELEAEGEAAEVCYRNQTRYTSTLHASRLAANDTESAVQEDGNKSESIDAAKKHQAGTAVSLAFSEEEVLWITGGTRGLGYACARHFVERHGVRRLVLSGREELPPREQWDTALNSKLQAKVESIRQLEALGAQVKVLALPLSDRQLVEQHVESIRSEWGPIAGVIHCAGSWDLDHPAFIRKPLEVIREVAEPKTSGFETLYSSLKAEPLRFFVLFSSVSAVIPTLGAGRSDYAMANAYLDYAAGAYQSSCPIVSIQWPSWKETGLGVVSNKAYDDTGLHSLTTKEGLDWLDWILSHRIGPVVMPAVVDPTKWNPEQLMDRYVVRAQEAAPIGTTVPPLNKHENSSSYSPSDQDLMKETEAWLTSFLAKELKTDAAKLMNHVPFQDYGMDSIMLAQIVRQMDRSLDGVSIDPASFIEHGTIAGMTRYLVEQHKDAMIQLLTPSKRTASLHMAMSNVTNSVQPDYRTVPHMSTNEAVSRQSAADQASRHPNSDGANGHSTRTANPQVISIRQPNPQKRAAPLPDSRIRRDKIAVVGMACHFPGANSIDAYWHNLRLGKDMMGEVPLSRWNWRNYYDSSQHLEGKSISKWGAFLDQIEYFDPEYFHIAESLAAQIDPLQRQWLEVSAEALADAGYGKRDLWGKRVGVFTGTRSSNFASKYCGTTKDVLVATGQNFIAAHLSHIYNFKGPNMVVDAACASSLTAIHLAVRSIQTGEAEMALAGGVEILLDETMYLDLSAAKILSPEGRCRTFDSAANGIGLGEGCGVLVLKPLTAAIADGNKIYGVIDGTAINNDGNTMGVTTPNPEAQRELIESALEDGGIHPDTISYVEAHGTGTLIGDPIELKALTQVFSKYTSKTQYCGVGSVKTNLGHLLSAAGAASIMKVLLSMTAGELPPTLHCSHPNPRFNFEDSPFYLVREVQAWRSQHHVLRAGISSFGLGGNNAHIIVSNEGIPAPLRATLSPKGEKITFNRRRFWPQTLHAETAFNDWEEHVEDDGFAGFFEPVQITR
ncbi:beta-ketoacyl synthase N-terminal-like domain-containing protein [Paenibacillus sp. 1001270B_150601_E10]|uniref:beta-ketoacyl synthase N-terminal-like domain-containing protein n=1 Tax=Paenibacillus sp. 1001270B_150601_E10 TaxID=2787079 RepID=UPI00189CBFDF|nr:beta-ketoacyl synthase N-terminal-like domain-containing protein [Paenibacillus sp. 1001270B_150601_E10]